MEDNQNRKNGTNKVYSDKENVKNKHVRSNSMSNRNHKKTEIWDKFDVKLNIYTVTWNLNGKLATEQEIRALLPKDKKYHIYAIGSEECMRSIFKSFFISDKTEWEKMIM
jgi:hypothetical protein